MKYHATLVGSQVLPVYLGIAERKPDKVFFVCTNESRAHVPNVVAALNGIDHEIVTVPAFDYSAILQAGSDLLGKHMSASWELNFTSGTKIMALAMNQLLQWPPFSAKTTTAASCMWISTITSKSCASPSRAPSF